MIEINVPVEKDLTKLKTGDVISLTGKIITARDQAHKRIIDEEAPINIENTAIFHAGPIITKNNENYEMIAIGPTTSMRMNPYQADVIAMGPKIIIGKGGMNDEVRQALKKHGAIYAVATGGCAALYVDKVKKISGVNWLDLGMPEAIWELEVEKFGPLIVAMDSNGNSLYDEN